MTKNNATLDGSANIEQADPAQACFPQPDDPSVRVWRYLDLAKFVWLLENKKLYLSRLDLLNDPHEGSIPKFQANQLHAELVYHAMQPINSDSPELSQSPISHATNILEQFKSTKKYLRKTFYVNCWHLNNSESEAMWRLYCPNNSGVAIQTTYKKLAESALVEPYRYIGCVTYLDYDSQGFPTDNLYHPIMHKRLSFAHEKEVRLVISKMPENWGTSQEFSVQGISIDWPLESIVDAIYVNPYAPDYYHDVVRTIVNKITPKLTETVVWSKMRSAPEY